MIDDHERYMRQAIQLGARGNGQTADNPSVGCVIVSAQGQIIGLGTTAPGGRPHAESQALAMAGDQAIGATVYVTLEPCAHYGKTSPCLLQLIQAQVAHVVIGCIDPDPRVAGRSIVALRGVGIKVTLGILAAEAAEGLADYLSVHQKGRPLITVKLATTLDARVATVSGHSQWITGLSARQSGHLWRSRHDAIAVGRGTMLADRPSLTCRLPGLHDRSPRRVVFDRLGRSLDLMRLWDLSHSKAILFCNVETAIRIKGEDVDLEAGLTIVPITDKQGRLNLGACLDYLIDTGIKSLLIEGGSQLVTSFLKEKLVDRIVWYSSPKLIGGDGLAAVLGLDTKILGNSINLKRKDIYQFPDGDQLSIYDVETLSGQKE